MPNNSSTLMIPLVSLMIGWMLNEFSHHIRARKLHKGALGKAVAELLEIWHQMIAISKAMSYVKEMVTTKESITPDMYNKIIGILPDPEAIKKRYNSAIDIIAESDPILAYQLRSKDIVFNLVSIFINLNINEGNVKDYLESVSNTVYGKFMTEYEESIKLVAFKHSIYTWLEVRRLLRAKRPNEVAEELKKEIKFDIKKFGT